MNIKEDIIKLSTKNYKLSVGWCFMIRNLQNYLENGDLELFKINGIQPHVFSWPESSIQNQHYFNLFEKDKNSIFYKAITSSNTYGPKGIALYKNVQLDRVAHTVSIQELVTKLNFDLSDTNEIIFEFGAGTGQMADVLKELNFQGTHIAYDLPLMLVLQNYFVTKKNIETKYILDDEDLTLIKGTNYVGCNQIDSETKIMESPNINFIATYSLTETDIDTHNKFAEYMVNFKRILIIYHPKKLEMFDNIDNDLYIRQLKQKLEDTHYCNMDINLCNQGSNLFCAVRK